MMATRLTDGELAARVRASNQRRAQRQQEKRRASGLAQLNVWVSATTKAQVEAARQGATLNEVAERLLLAGLHATTTPAGTVDTPPVYTVEGGDERAALMAEVGKLLNEGLSGNEVARRLNASGRRTASGSAFTGANLLRDYRGWLKKTGATDTITPAAKRDARSRHESDC